MQKYRRILNTVKDEISSLNENLVSNYPEISKFLKSPSKHIRPLISFLYLKAIGKNINKTQIKYQTAIELVHNASLIHDDVIDESQTRRGGNSLNKDIGNKMAVISGDYLLSLALENVVSIGTFELVEMFCRTLKNMTFGEIEQNLSRFKIPSIEEYLKKTEYKTAQLFDLSLKGSLKIAQVNTDNNFAKFFGIAFQIRDDLINYKTVQTDINDGIYTAPVIFSGSTKVSDDGLEKTRTLLNNYIEKAEKSIIFLKESIYKKALFDLLKELQYE